MKKIHFDMQFIVWGDEYTKVFLDYVLPNYLSENNVPVTSREFSLAASIYTTARSEEQIRTHKHFRKLQEYIPIEICTVIAPEMFLSRNKYSVKGIAQSCALKKAIANKSVALLLSPDVFISDGGLNRCCHLIAKGYRVVQVTALKTETESVLGNLSPFLSSDGSVLTLPNRKLIELGSKNLHPINKKMFWHGDQFSKWPSMVCWKTGAHSILAKFFHFHPIAIDLRSVRRRIPEVLMCDDGGLIEYLKMKPSEIYGVAHSDEFACIEFSSRHLHPQGLLPCDPKERVKTVLGFSFKYTLGTHIGYFLKMNVRFQAEESVNWEQAESFVAKDLKTILKILPIIRAINSMRYSLFLAMKFVAIKIGLRYVIKKWLRKSVAVK